MPNKKNDDLREQLRQLFVDFFDGQMELIDKVASGELNLNESIKTHGTTVYADRVLELFAQNYRSVDSIKEVLGEYEQMLSREGDTFGGYTSATPNNYERAVRNDLRKSILEGLDIK